MSSKKILLADDDKVFTTIIESLLTKNGYEVFVAGNGNDAINALTDFKADLIILDVLMPGLTGYEAMQKMKAKGFNNIPLIVTSSNKNMKDYFENWEISGFLTKPFEPQGFLTKLEEILTAQEMKTQGEILKKQRVEWIQIFAPGLYSLSGKKILLVTGNEFVAIQIRSYLECANIHLLIVPDDKAIRAQGVKFEPDFILFEWYEGLELGESGMPVYWEACQKYFDLKKIPYVIYHESKVDFVPFNPKYPILSYYGAEHLVKSFSRFLSRPPQQAAG